MTSELGKIFRDEREKRNLSIQDVSSVLRIHPRILVALEAGDKKNLPALTFVKGFVRNYAYYLKVPSEVALDFYNKEYLGHSTHLLTETSSPVGVANLVTDKGAPDLIMDAPRNTSSNGKGNHPVKFYLVFGLSLILIVLTGILVSQFQNRVKSTAVISDAPVVEPVLGASAVSSGGSSEQARSAEASPVLTEPPLEKSPVPAPAGMAVPQLSANTLAPLKTPTSIATPVSPTATPAAPLVSTTPKSTSEEAEAKLPEKEKAGDQKKSYEIVVETQKPVQLEFSYDGKTFKKTDLLVDSVQTFKTKNKLFLKASDGGAILVSVNGVLHKTKGEAGVPLEMTIP